jgi:hypothetical protein
MAIVIIILNFLKTVIVYGLVLKLSVSLNSLKGNGGTNQRGESRYLRGRAILFRPESDS